MSCAEYEQLLSHSTERAAGETADVEGAPLLLVVDEDPDRRLWMEEQFRACCTVRAVADAAAACEAIDAHAAALTVVVVSMTLPGDGAARVMRSCNSTDRVPVLAVVPPDPALERRAFALGMDDVAYRPLDEASLKRRLLQLQRRLLQLQRRAHCPYKHGALCMTQPLRCPKES